MLKVSHISKTFTGGIIKKTRVEAVVSSYSHSLLGKLIVYAKTREEDLRKMRAALCELVIGGISTNIEEQLRIVEDERFISGNYDLAFMGNR